MRCRNLFTGDQSKGFSLTAANCFDNLSHTHEMGHNFGCVDVWPLAVTVGRITTGAPWSEYHREHTLCVCDTRGLYFMLFTRVSDELIVSVFYCLCHQPLLGQSLDGSDNHSRLSAGVIIIGKTPAQRPTTATASGTAAASTREYDQRSKPIPFSYAYVRKTK